MQHIVFSAKYDNDIVMTVQLLQQVSFGKSAPLILNNSMRCLVRDRDHKLI